MTTPQPRRTGQEGRFSAAQTQRRGLPLSDRSLLIVNYRSAAFTAGAIASARETAGDGLQVVVVDNSCDREERRRLEQLPIDELLVSPRNRGYAGGINDGIDACAGTFVVISNPDVIFMSQAIEQLVGSVSSGAAMSGPKFVWDRRGEWLLPPASAPRLADKVDEVISAYSRSRARKRDRSRIAARLRFWMLDRPASVEALSGAVMCMRTADVRRMGGFDESYPLYFEEIDFMRRLRRAGRRVMYVPAAVCRHLYNQSAGISPETALAYQTSELRYFWKWSGSTAVHFMAAMGKPREEEQPSQIMESGEMLELPGSAADFLIESSPIPSFESAAGCFPRDRHILFPTDVLETYRHPKLYLRVVERSSLEVISKWVIDKSA